MELHPFVEARSSGDLHQRSSGGRMTKMFLYQIVNKSDLPFCLVYFMLKFKRQEVSHLSLKMGLVPQETDVAPESAGPEWHSTILFASNANYIIVV
jgi:hypothetical protein